MRGLRIIVGLALVVVADKANSLAKQLVEPVFGEELCHVGDGSISVWESCDRCTGKGYHHGFGIDGIDPDWCEQCGGPGSVARDVTLEDVRPA